MTTIIVKHTSGKRIEGLYTIEDVRHVNAMRVKCCKSSYEAWHVKTEKILHYYSAKELNDAWKCVSK